MKKQGLLVLIMLAVVVGGCGRAHEQMYQGVVEAPVYSHASEVAGKIVEMPVALGQSVQAGDVLAVLGDSDAQYALEQLEATRAKKQATLDELFKGAEPEAVRQGKNNVTMAQAKVADVQAAADQARVAYHKQQVLAEGGAVAQSVLDDLQYRLDAADRAQAQAEMALDNAQAQLSLLTAGATKEKLAYAQADLAQTTSQIAQARENLTKYTIKATVSGVVLSQNYLLGDLVQAGYDLVDLSAAEEKYLVVYLPEAQLAQLTYGQRVTMRSQQGDQTGEICFIDVKAQYTPKDFQTAANKNQDTVKIKIRLANDSPLKPGEQAQLVLGVK